MSHSDEDAEAIVNKHIKLLHEYNEAKVFPKVTIAQSIEAYSTSYEGCSTSKQICAILTSTHSQRRGNVDHSRSGELLPLCILTRYVLRIAASSLQYSRRRP